MLRPMGMPAMCWDPILKRNVPCPDPSSGTGGRGKSESPQCCFDDTCGVDCEMLNYIVASLQTRAVGATGLASSVSPVSIGAFIPTDPRFEFSAITGELIFDGVGTGYFFANITNVVDYTTDAAMFFAMDVAGNGLCPDFSLHFTLNIVWPSPGQFLVESALVQWCTRNFGAVVPTAGCSGCSASQNKCSLNTPVLGNTTFNISGGLPPGATVITLPNPLIQGGDNCCEILGLSTDAPFVSATAISANQIRLVNYNPTVVDTPFRIVFFTTCGVVPGATLDLTFTPPCSGTVTPVPETVYIGRIDTPAAGQTLFVRKSNLYTVDDPSGCCDPITITSGDARITAIVDAGATWQFTINATGLYGPELMNININSNCGIKTKQVVVNVADDGTCAGTITMLETSLNDATTGATFLVPAGGQITVALTFPLWSGGGPCCAEDGVLYAVPLVNTLTDLYTQPTTNGQGGSNITLYARPGATPGSVKTETITLSHICGGGTLDITYQIV